MFWSRRVWESGGLGEFESIGVFESLRVGESGSLGVLK